MAKNTGENQNCKNYGVPLYGAGWVPSCALGSITDSSKAGDGDDSTSLPPSSSVVNHIYLAGGGGKGRSGIPNALLISKYDPELDYLSDEPVTKLEMEEEIPYRVAAHPKGKGIICALPRSCRWFEWDVDSTDDHHLCFKTSEEVVRHLEDVEQQLALTFNDEGSLLAVGGEDGKLRVLEWPSMDLALDADNAHSSVKDLDFSPDGKILVSVGGGSAKVWDVEKSTVIASLQKANDEVFAFCRFSRAENEVLYIIAMHDKGVSILKWNTCTWKKISSNTIARDPISAFNVSADGRHFAVGTVQGDVFILSSSNMRIHTSIKKAHIGVVTALAFSQDSRYLVSVSMASSARVTQIKDVKKKGFPLWIIIFIVLLAIAAYNIQTKGLLSTYV